MFCWLDARKKKPKRREIESLTIFPYVLCYHPFGDPEYQIAAYDEEQGVWFNTQDFEIDVLVWQHLPEPPMFHLVEGGDYIMTQGG